MLISMMIDSFDLKKICREKNHAKKKNIEKKHENQQVFFMFVLFLFLIIGL